MATIAPVTTDLDETQFLAEQAAIQQTGAVESLSSTVTQESLSAGDKLSQEAANVNK